MAWVAKSPQGWGQWGPPWGAFSAMGKGMGWGGVGITPWCLGTAGLLHGYMSGPRVSCTGEVCFMFLRNCHCLQPHLFRACVILVWGCISSSRRNWVWQVSSALVRKCTTGSTIPRVCISKRMVNGGHLKEQSSTSRIWGIWMCQAYERDAGMYIMWEESRGSIFFNSSNHITSQYSYRASLPALCICGKIF